MNRAVYTKPLSFSSLFAFCGLPIRLDSYRGCGFGCSYCFARARESVSGSPRLAPADPVFLERIFKRVFDDERGELSVVSKCIKRRMPLHFGVMGDPFQPIENRYKVTLRYLEAIRKYQYPVVISTRGSLVATTPYIDILRELQAVVVRLSLSTTDDERSRAIEGKSVPSETLRTMERLSAAGIPVACRWQPYVPGYSEGVETFSRRVANAGCRQCSFEFLRLPREQNPRLVDAFQLRAGKNIYEYYSGCGSLHRVREFVLPAEVRLPVILEARKAIRSAGMRFGSAENDLQYLSDDACCCCGVDALPGFGAYFRHQIAYAVRKSLGGKLRYQTIAEEWAPTGSVDRYLSSTRAKQGSVVQHIRARWNASGLEGSPDSFFGVKPTHEFSPDGMRVYEWDVTKLRLLDS
jgi:DNA repair photolyase